MRLITHNPAKYSGLDGYGIEIVDRVGIPLLVTPENVRYLHTKRQRMGHFLPEIRVDRVTEGSGAEQATADGAHRLAN